MKRLATLLILVTLLALIGCGNDNNSSTTNTPTETATPGEVVQQLAKAMEDGDTETLKALWPTIETDLGFTVYVLGPRWSDSAKANGGVTTVTIDNETVKDDKAKVTATLTNGNGTSSTQTFDLAKQDGKWIISIDDSEVQ
jgi:hypothetical protein